MKDKIFKKGIHGVGAKFIALALTVMLVVTMIPGSAFVTTASAAVSDKVSDTSTINEWQEYFLDLEDKGTEYAGGVWTDKSVFKSGSDFDAALSGGEAKTGIQTGEDNFLISMSALATNKEIVGYSTIPTDTMFVLDVSQSMDNARSVDDMVDAANEAIASLLELNKNNRVGVVLYSGKATTGAAQTSTGTLLLGINRYTPAWNGDYLECTGSSDTTVSVANNVRVEGGSSVRDTSKNTAGGTYIQNGLDIAMDQFLNADPIVKEGNVQTGDIRMPIFVLMSDGAPTHATTSYTNIGTSNMGTGEGSTSTAGVGFATQLTAAYAKAKTEDHYGTEAKFYTLGLNLSGTTGQAVANSVMNPAQSTNAINQYWNTLFTNGSVRFTAHNTDGNQQYFTITRDGSDMLVRDDQNYVDRYFDADSNDKLEDAFKSIVAEIILQSAYYPTYIETGDRDLSGYVSFSDEIGHFMEVKEIKGVLLGNKMFTGEILAKMMQSGEFGNVSTYTEKGWELVETVSERIGVDESTAITLLQNAWRDGQLYYNSDTDYDNYIGWYEGANGEYISFWSQNDGEAAQQAAIQNGAKYITKSYGYYGSNADEGNIVGSDMMHVIVKVRTDITTGLQEVIFEIPASLVPIITYGITLDADSYEEARTIEMDVEEETPIRLLFEVGLKDEINEYNLTQIMEAEGTHSHPVEDTQGNPTGEYYFYTNVWGYGSDQSQLVPGQHQVAESVFTPSTVNERYYYTEDTLVLEKTGENSYEPYKGAAAPTGDGYHRAYRIFRHTGSGNSAEMIYVHEPIGAETLSYNNGANVAKNEDGEWYIKEGAARSILPSYRIQKLPLEMEGGPTETLVYSRYASINPSESDADYFVYSFQGNNGRLKMAPATGIELTKKTDGTITNKDIEYTFVITHENAGNGTYTLYKNGAESDIKFNDGSATVTLKADETVIIAGLPAGKYTITETVAENAGYKVSSVTVDKVTESGNVAEDTIAVNNMDSVVFTNTEARDGDLIVRKNVTNNYPDAATAVNSKEFTFTVVFKDADGKALTAGTVFAAEGKVTDGKVTLDAKGSFTTVLKHNESVTVKDIPEGVTYVVTESDLPEGFEQVTPAADMTGSIENNETSVVTVVNDYRPEGAPAVNVEMTKTMTGRAWESGDSFSFRLEKMNVDGTWSNIGTEQTITTDGGSATFQIPQSELDKIGTYYFRVIELNPNAIPGITSDAARYIRVIVTEKDGDGKMEIDSISGNNVTVDNNGVSMNFENVYSTSGEATVSIPIEKRINNSGTGVIVPLEGFEFQLTDAAGNPVDVNGSEEGTNVKSNFAGEAVIHLAYTSEEFENLDTDDNNKVDIYYTLSEVAKTSNTITYDNTVYNVIVTLNSVGGKLTSSVQIADDAGIKDEAVFTNTFDIPENGEAEFQLNAKKTLNGRAMVAGEFNFNLYKTDADFVIPSGAAAVADGTNAADGTIAFDTLTYDAAGTYYYVAKEVVPTNTAGVTYSGAEYYVTVNVTYDEPNDKLVAAETIVKPGTGVIQEADIEFINEYKVKPTSVTLSGTKVLTGRDLVRGDFEFVLMEGDDEIARTVNTSAGTNNGGVATGTFKFPAIEYTEPGTHEYTVKEVIPVGAENNKLNGMTYDATVFTVKVNVVDNGDGTMTATPTIEGGTDGKLVFKNTYKPAPAAIDLTAKKELENRELKAGEFSFGVYKADNTFAITDENPVSTGVNAANGNIDFSEITVSEAGTYYYVMKEEIPSADSADRVTDVVYDELEYHITAVVWDMGGQLNARVTYTANGLPAAAMTFSNVYFEPTPAVVNLEASKAIIGRDLEAGEFEFALYETNSEFKVLQGGYTDTAKNEADGTVKFKSDIITAADMDDGIDEQKTFYYIIKEIVPDAEDKEGIGYDDSYFEVSVTVKNNGKGALVAEDPVIVEVDGNDADPKVDGAAAFNNTYTATDAKLTLGGTKTLENKNLSENDFTFVLYEADEHFNKTGSDAKATAKNKADGSFVFDELTYSAADIGKTYYYVVEEKAGDDAGNGNGEVAYDEAVYKIKVTVSDNLDGEIVLDINYDDTKVITQTNVAEIKDLNFVNGFNPEDAVLNIIGEKLMDGRSITAGEFTFELYKTESNYKVDDNAVPVQTKVNDDNNKFAFDSIICDTLENGQEATSYYVVKEYAPEDKKGVTYDETEYQIEVTVKNNGDGKISQTVKLDGKSHKGDTVVLDTLKFENSYKSTLPEDIELGISGQKYLTGDRATVEKGEFTFLLSEVVTENNQEVVKELDKAKVDADGTFEFDAIDTYTEPGVHQYRVTEKASNAEGMTYDTTVYDVTVEIVDDMEGNLVITAPVITANGNVVEAIEFNNVYDEPEKPVPTYPEVVVEKFHAVNGGELTKDKLTAKAGEEIKYIITVKNDGTESAKDIVVTDKIPEGLTVVEGSLTSINSEDSIYEIKDGVLTWNIDELRAGTSLYVEFIVVVPEVDESTDFTNIATFVYGNDPDDPVDPDESNEVVVEVESEDPVVPENPTEPTQPEQPTKPMDETSDGGTQTGDDFNGGLYGFLALAALAVAGVAFRRRKAE